MEEAIGLAGRAPRQQLAVPDDVLQTGLAKFVIRLDARGFGGRLRQRLRHAHLRDMERAAVAELAVEGDRFKDSEFKVFLRVEVGMANTPDLFWLTQQVVRRPIVQL